MTLYLRKYIFIKKTELMKITTVDHWLKRAPSACKQATSGCPSASTPDVRHVLADVSQAHIQDDPAHRIPGTSDVFPVLTTDTSSVQSNFESQYPNVPMLGYQHVVFT